MCAIVGTLRVKNAAIHMRSMLHAVQNRGRDGCGMALVDYNNSEPIFRIHKTPGTVAKKFTPEVIETLAGKEGVGHTRYATAANSAGNENLQPLFFEVDGVPFTVAHNGNFTNCPELEQGELKGTPFNTHSDTERFLRLILREHRSEPSLEKSVARALSKMTGSCSAVLHTPGLLLAIRDSSGNRPLFWGQKGKGYVVASEPCALDAIDVFNWQEVPAGTIMSFTKDKGVQTYELPSSKLHMCTFELVYFGFPTSTLFGIQVGDFRVALGRKTAELFPVKTDLVCPIPDSAIEAGNGYAQKMRGSNADYGIIMRRHDTGRTFIIKGQQNRRKAVTEKFDFLTRKIKGKSIVLIDDSLVRGTTSLGISKALYRRGAKEIHWRIPSPKVIESCFYGIATADRKKLLASHMSLQEIRNEIKADSLEYLNLDDFKKVIDEHDLDPNNGCYTCMDGIPWHT